MIRDSAVDLLMGRLGNRSNATLQQAVIDEMVFVQENVLEGALELPWFCLSEKSYAVTTPSEERLALPSDFLAEWEEGDIFLLESDGSQTPLIRADWDVIKIQDSLKGSGKPTHYDIGGDYYLFRKIPDDTYTIQQRYYQRQTSLAGSYGDAANVENNWLKWASDWLLAETGIRVAKYRLQSEKMANLFVNDVVAARERIRLKNIAMIESNKIRSMGD